MSNTNLLTTHIALLVICGLLEHYLPKITKQANSLRKLVVVLIVWLLGLGVVALCQRYLFIPLIDILAPLQLFSVAQFPVPIPVGFLFSFLLLDVMQYWIHRISHTNFLLWAIHSVHHSDRHVTAATGLLHHPFEVILLFVITLTFLILCGISLHVIIAYSLCSMAHNFLSHLNVALPVHLDRALRLFIVTPDMHRTHHSIQPNEGNSNFGQIFPFWDRLFGTYLATPSRSVDCLKMGLPAKTTSDRFTVPALLLQPFRVKNPVYRLKTK